MSEVQDLANRQRKIDTRGLRLAVREYVKANGNQQWGRCHEFFLGVAAQCAVKGATCSERGGEREPGVARNLGAGEGAAGAVDAPRGKMVRRAVSRRTVTGQRATVNREHKQHQRLHASGDELSSGVKGRPNGHDGLLAVVARHHRVALAQGRKAQITPHPIARGVRLGAAAGVHSSRLNPCFTMPKRDTC